MRLKAASTMMFDCATLYRNFWSRIVLILPILRTRQKQNGILAMQSDPEAHTRLLPSDRGYEDSCHHRGLRCSIAKGFFDFMFSFCLSSIPCLRVGCSWSHRMKYLLSLVATTAIVPFLGCALMGSGGREYLTSAVPPGEFTNCMQHGETMTCLQPNATADTWTRTFSIRTSMNRLGESEGLSPEEYAAAVAENIRKYCSAVSSNIIDSRPQPLGQVKRSILFEVKMSGCSRAGPEEEYHLIRVLYTESNFFRITYRARTNELPLEERDKWIQQFSEATVTLTPPPEVRLRIPTHAGH